MFLPKQIQDCAEKKPVLMVERGSFEVADRLDRDSSSTIVEKGIVELYWHHLWLWDIPGS